MAANAGVEGAFSDFCAWLSEHRHEQVAQLQQVVNGAEGWLKVEFYLWLVAHRGLAPTTTDVPKDIGLEYKVHIDSRRFRRVPRRRVRKQCDLWIRAAKSPPLFDYVELKYVFNNGNRGKMLQSAGDDMRFMSRLRAGYEQARSGNIIVVGVGFSEDGWREAARAVKERAGLAVGVPHSGEGTIGPGGRLRWFSLTHSYVDAKPKSHL